ncbi:Pentatricopeptide repeat-containing protein, chloroplastic [Neolecta irregularis DAH-3]|uniref:Pentatricopeptide repeat-containing protein, chloroplastic n=1 Tax=Neolecta irregularis (strain DAH-3) TaxID=1198029 RepID=A0A1U7LV85_NEOID|nr:Pentatricopeptide repeat-containing protein, chloroplastic [Neolecta irregularis DAH-3]|eukprot:OLL26554.1 Pentatricopeptide repeat-containing protein, chloroplastic [Neolecta irregularis DAH-3]
MLRHTRKLQIKLVLATSLNPVSLDFSHAAFYCKSFTSDCAPSQDTITQRSNITASNVAITSSKIDAKYISELAEILQQTSRNPIYDGWNIFAKITDGNAIPADLRHQYLELLRQEGRERDYQRIIFMVERIDPQNRTPLEDTYRITSLKNIGQGSIALKLTDEFLQNRQLDDLQYGVIQSMIRWLVENNRLIEAIHLWEKTAARFLVTRVTRKFKDDGYMYLDLIFKNVEDPIAFLRQSFALGGPANPQTSSDARRFWLETFISFLAEDCNHDPLSLLGIHDYCESIKWNLKIKVTTKILTRLLDAGLLHDRCIEIYQGIRKRAHVSRPIDILTAMLPCAMFRDNPVLVKDIFNDFLKVKDFISVPFFNLAMAYHSRRGEVDAVNTVFEELIFKSLQPNAETFAALMYAHDFYANSTPVIRRIISDNLDPTVVVQYLLDRIYEPTLDIDTAVRTVANLISTKVPVTMEIIEKVMSMAAARGHLKSAQYAFRIANAHNLPLSIDAANSYLKCHVNCGWHKETTDLFGDFRKLFGVEPDKTTWLIKLRSDCALKDVEKFRSNMEKMVKEGYLADAQSYGILFEVMCNNNELETAQELFDGLSVETSVVLPDGNMYAIMMGAYLRAGQPEKVRSLYLKMTATNTPPTVMALAIFALAQGQLMRPNLTSVNFPKWIHEIFISIRRGERTLDLTDPYSSFSTFPFIPSSTKNSSVLRTSTSRILFCRVLANIYRSPQIRAQPPVQLRTATALLRGFVDAGDETAIDLMWLYIRRRVKSLIRYPYQNEETAVASYICRAEKHALSHPLYVFLKSRSTGRLAPSSTKFPFRIPYRRLDYLAINLSISALAQDDHSAFKAFWLAHCQLNRYISTTTWSKPNLPFPRLNTEAKIQLLAAYRRWKRGETRAPIYGFRMFNRTNRRHIEVRYPDVISCILDFERRVGKRRLGGRINIKKPGIRDFIDTRNNDSTEAAK